MNWEALDALVIEFAKSDNLIEESLSSPSSSSSYKSRLLIRQIRRLLESGNVDSAIDLLRLHAPFVLDDHRLLFRLQKQRFIELLRRGTVEDRDSAINCLRRALAPCALDAYPEAYEEFKHVLLAFIYDKDDHTSPVANEWSERRRFDIAGLMSSVLRAHLRAYDPLFSMTMRYLISIHRGFSFRQGYSSPVSDLTERLLLDERDPPATPEECLYEAPPFDEVDIQALAHAVELTRQGAVDSLKFAKGDLFQAFQNELCRMKFDVSMLDELVREYCVYRGIVNSAYIANEKHASVQENSSCISRNSSAEVSSNSNSDTVNMQDVEIEERYPNDTASNHEDCSTSEIHQSEISKVIQKNRTHLNGERNKRKRWRGRDDEAEYKEQQQASEISSVNGCREDKYEIVLGMKELASRGMVAEVVQEINSVDPNFFLQNPHLLFQLKQVEFLKYVRCGDHSDALKVACSHLGPLAAQHQALLKPLKETLLALLRPNEDAFNDTLPLYALATSLQVAIGRRLGIEEPQLMKIMRATLYTHTEWFKLQMCKDRFQGFLKIDSLKEVNKVFVNDGSEMDSKSNVDNANSAHGSSQLTVSSKEDGSSSSPTQESSRDLACDENAILKVMEFLALPRADAIHLLAQYNGNAETVIQQIFA